MTKYDLAKEIVYSLRDNDLLNTVYCWDIGDMLADAVDVVMCNLVDFTIVYSTDVLL